MKTTRYIYTALILAALSQGNAVAQNKGGFFSKVRDTFSTEIKIGNYTFEDAFRKVEIELEYIKQTEL